MSNSVRKYQGLAIFLLVAFSFYALGVYVVLHATPDYREFVAAVALPFDLMVFLPAMFYVFVIRKYKVSLLLLLPICWLGGFIVSQIAQPQNIQLVLVLGAAALLAEISIGVYEIARLLKVFKESRRSSSDPVVWFTDTFFALTKNRAISRLLAFECTTMFYALFSWRSRPMIASGEKAFSYHQKSGYVPFVAVLMGISVIEIFVVHLLLLQVSAVLALVVTVLSLYLMIWLLGNMRASMLRPVSVSSSAVTVRSGVFYSASVPLKDIENLDLKNPGFTKQEILNLGIMGEPSCWIIPKQTLEIETLFGKKRLVKAIGLTLDETAEFRKLVTQLKDEESS